MTFCKAWLKHLAGSVQITLKISAWKALLFTDMHTCFLTIFYLLIVSGTGASSLHFLGKVLGLTVSLGLYIVYMFLVNDYCDMPTDKIAGKSREIHCMPRMQVIGLILLVFLLGQIVTITIIGQTLYMIVYLAAYFLATFYSAHPLRFKSKGLLGTISDALIEKVFPALLILSFFQYFYVDALFLLILFFFWEAQLITVHQYLDYEGDVKAQVKTLVVEIGLKKAIKIVKHLQLVVASMFVILSGIMLIKVPYSAVFFIFIIVGYFGVQKLKLTNSLAREPGSGGPSRFYVGETNLFDSYYAFINVCFEGPFPLFAGLILTLAFPPYIILLLLSFASQYYFVRGHYYPAFRGALALFQKKRARQPSMRLCLPED